MTDRASDAPIQEGWSRRRALLAITATLLAALLPLCLWGLTARLSQGDANGDGQEQREALAQWQSLWADLNARGETALQPEVAETSLRAAGDTAFMRYRNLWGRIDASARHTFQMAALSNDPLRKLGLLAPLATATDARTRFRALLEIARVHLRLRALDPAREAARAALAVADPPPRVRADAHFVLGYIAWEAGSLDDAEAALGLAVNADSGFWDARQLRLQVLGRQLAQPRQGTAACLNRTRQMILDLGALPSLARDRTQFRDIADHLTARGTPANPAFALVSGLGYLWAGDRVRARAALASAESMHGQLPAACERLILAKTREWLSERL